MEELPSQYDPKNVEARIYNEWLTRGFFESSTKPLSSFGGSSSGGNLKPFTILLPPPNITGSLHMGHALNATISDILIRYHRMKGFRTAWLPGIDHAGIAAQNVVEKNLRKEGISRFDLGREKFITKVWEWKEKYGNIILDQLKKLGASCDWSQTRFTMDKNYSDDVAKAFVHYYEKGLIYRGKRIVSWCTRCGTSLSDLEIEHKEETGKLYFIKYPLVDNIANIIVATTRPETMLGDAAVAVNPQDKRYKDLIGQLVKLPLTNREIPIIADDGIEIGFGTGMVKVTPAHDLLDSEIGARHNLTIYEIINERGKMTELVGIGYQGLKVLECREKVIQDLQALDLIEKIEDYSHSLATCYRCATTLEPLLSNQWFLAMTKVATSNIRDKQQEKSLRDQVLEIIGSQQTKIVPENFEKPFIAWLNNTKDWCISRQIWWGHQLPVYFCSKNKQEERKMQNEKLKTEENTFIVSTEKPKKCPFCDQCDMEQAPDVLDTWFSSALWPFAGISEKDLKEFYPSSVLITARDIINLWVGRMIFSGMEFMGSTPFEKTLIHGTILTKDGKRMSKSLGTGIDPLVLIEKYGADATRFGIIWQAMGNQDIRWDEAAVLAGKKFTNKIWNAARFALGRNEAQNEKQKVQTIEPKTEQDKIILGKLASAKKTLEQNITSYDFGQGLHTLYDFFWHDFCDIYLEASKNQKDENTNQILLNVLLESLKMLHPFMPHITEEIYQKLPIEHNSWLILNNWD